MREYLDAIKGDRIAEGRTDLVVPFAEFKSLVGFDTFRDLERRYLPTFIE
jgi:methylisocitrate lyase